MGVSQNQGYLFGHPYNKDLVFGGLYWGLILRNISVICNSHNKRLQDVNKLYTTPLHNPLNPKP